MRVNSEENERFWDKKNILSSTNEKYSLLHILMITYDSPNEIKTIYDMLLHGLWQLFHIFENHVIVND